MSLKALAIALVVIALTGTVVAQESPRECGDFDFFREQNMQRVAAAEILKDLRSCGVRVVNAIVDGNLSWPAATIEHGLTFHDVRITRSVFFRSTTFEADVIFVDTIFESGADFEFATFERDADFRDTIFKAYTLLRHTTFKGDADFRGTTFGARAIFSDTTFEGRADISSTIFEASPTFSVTTFKGYADFSDTTFRAGATLFITTFKGTADFRGTIFEGKAEFPGTSFEAVVSFDTTTFEGSADFRTTLFLDRLSFLPRINGGMWPPNSGIIFSDLSWNQVKGTFPSGEDTIDMHGRWENFFTLSNKASDAEQVRTSRRRFQLRFWVWTVAGSFVGWWLLFTLVYYWCFRKYRRGSRPHHSGKLLLFSLDVISPSIRPWKYDWGQDGRLPVRRVVAITAVESAIGWILLGLGSAIAVAWLTA